MQISTSTRSRYGNGLWSLRPVVIWLLLLLHLDQCECRLLEYAWAVHNLYLRTYVRTVHNYVYSVGSVYVLASPANITLLQLMFQSYFHCNRQ